MSRRVITQIYNISSVDEALSVIATGVDNIGMEVNVHREPGDTRGFEMCRKVVKAVGSKATTVMILIDDSLEECIKWCKYCKPDIVHLSGRDVFSTPQFMADVKIAVPGIKVMQAIPVRGPEAVPMAVKFAQFVDLLILDTDLPERDEIGAAGVVHDWDIDKAIVDAVDIPVIIAGGLGPDNVAKAIRYIKPYGVDSLTKTNQVREDDKKLKDISLVAAFHQAAKSVVVED